jgi:phosphoribosylformylglycinamidine synthase
MGRELIVNVYLKPEILDPQGRAVLASIKRLGMEKLLDVRQGKQFRLYFDNEISDLEMHQLEQIAISLLSNPVIENFTIEVKQ